MLVYLLIMFYLKCNFIIFNNHLVLYYYYLHYLMDKIDYLLCLSEIKLWLLSLAIIVLNLMFNAISRMILQLVTIQLEVTIQVQVTTFIIQLVLVIDSLFILYLYCQRISFYKYDNHYLFILWSNCHFSFSH